MDFLYEIGSRIRSLRQSQNLSQDDLARMAGYTSRSSINKIEKGLVDLPQSKISLIAAALNVSPSYLLYGESDNKNAPAENNLSESERVWIELYRKLSPEVRETFVTLVEKFDALPDGERQMLLAMIRGAIGAQAE